MRTSAVRKMDLGLSVTEYAEKKDFSAEDRKHLAKEGKAMPDGSYPITDAHDLASAIKLVGRGHDSEGKVKAHIIARAKALGLEGSLPESWKADKGDTTQEDPSVDGPPQPTSYSSMLKNPSGARLKKPSKFQQAQATPMDTSSISSSISAANS